MQREASGTHRRAAASAPMASNVRLAIMSGPASVFFLLIRLALKAVGPFSAARLIWCILTAKRHRRSMNPLEWLRSGKILASLGSLWLHAEGAFFFVSVIDRYWYGAWPRPRPPAYLPEFPKERRNKLLTRVLRDVSTPRETGRRWLCGWFGGCKYDDLRKGDLKEFFAWAWFDVFSYAELDSKKKHEVDDMILLLEDRLGSVAPGEASKTLKPQRQSIDPYWNNTTHHPLMLYAVFSVAVDLLAPWILVNKLGFVRRSAGRIKYYYHSGKSGSSESASKAGVVSRDRRAIIFWHGIGIGLAPYYKFLVNLLSLKRPVIVPEIPEAVCTIGTSAPIFRHMTSNSPVSVQQTVQSFDEMLKHVRDDVGANILPEEHQVSLIGHSFGTFVCSWLIEHRAHRLAHICLVDPVSVMLHHADVCDKFLYCKTSRLKEGSSTSKQIDELLRYFVRQEPGIVITLMRNFWWYKNTTWLEDLTSIGPERACLLLALKDEYCSIENIINGVSKINDEISQSSVSDKDTERLKRNKVQLCQYKNTVHGQFLGHDGMQRQVMKVISK